MQFDMIKVGMRCLKENSCNAIENDSERERETEREIEVGWQSMH